MRQYHKQKDIGWFGNIPASWNTSKIGELYSIKNIKVSDRDYPPLSVTKKGILPQLETAAKSDAHDDRKLVNKGDFVINSRSDRRGSCGISSLDGSVSLINLVLSPKTNLDPEYYNWLFHTELFADEFYRWGNGIVDDLWTTKWLNMKNIIVPVPTLEEQITIANYLSNRVQKFDKIISICEKVIMKYKEYKQSITTEVVTKGLYNDTKMKDSNIGWIGNIPASWNTSKIGELYSIKNIKVSDRDYPPLSVTKKGILPQLETAAKSDAHDDRKLVNKGDFVINSRSDRRGSCGISSLDGSVSLINLVLSPKTNLDPEYYNWLFHTELFADEFYRWGNGIVDDLWTTKWLNMKNIKIPVPPLKEQETLSNFLNEKCKIIDSLIFEREKLLDKLQEYKQSLIFEYVSGKKEVPK